MRFPIVIGIGVGISSSLISLIASNSAPSVNSKAVSTIPPQVVAPQSSAVVSKNMARYHMGTILEKFDPETRYYLPDLSAVAWLDEDDSTTCTIPTGKQWYLITLDSPTLIQNFSVAAESLTGKVTLYASDQKAVPGAKNWVPLLRAASAQDLKEKQSQKPLYTFTRYVLLETDLLQQAEVSSLYLFTDSDASTYRLVKRPEPSRFTDKAGPFYKDPKGQVNFAGKYARTTEGGENDNLSRMTDESPESSGSLDQKPMVIDLKETRQLERFSIFAEKKKGMMSISLEEDRANPAPLSTASIPEAVQMLLGVGWQKWGGMLVQSIGAETKISTAMNRSIPFDGSTDRFSIQVPVTPCRFLTMTWASGENPPIPIQIKNFSVMGYVSLNEFQVNRVVGTLERNSKGIPVDAAGATNSNTTESSGLTSGSTSLGNLAIKTEESLGLPPVVPVSN